MVKVCDNDICICHRVGSDLSKDGAAAETELELHADRDECLPCGHPSPAASSLLTLSPPARPGCFRHVTFLMPICVIPAYY